MPPRRTRKKGRRPPNPGPETCSPYAARRNKGSCLTPSVLKTIAARTLKHRGLTGLTSGGSRSLQAEIAKELGCKSNDERCILERSALSVKEKKSLLNTYFRPKMPEEWKTDPDAWLSSDDIIHVMKQYEKAYTDFKFLGVVPIDFSAPSPYTDGSEKKCMNDQFCHVNLKEERLRGMRIIGAVFNLDPHYKDGSHWVALAIDLKRNCVYYFDSYGVEPPRQVARFMRYLTLQEPALRLESNGRRFQFSNSECGMYSMYFIIRMIEGESFKKFCKNRIDDKYMLNFRKVLFDPEA
jgi:hypothetical protein